MFVKIAELKAHRNHSWCNNPLLGLDPLHKPLPDGAMMQVTGSEFLGLIWRSWNHPLKQCLMESSI